MIHVGSFTDGTRNVHQFSIDGTSGSILLGEQKLFGDAVYSLTIYYGDEDAWFSTTGISYPINISISDIELCRQVILKLIGKLLFECNSKNPLANQDLRNVLNKYSKKYVGTATLSDFRLSDKEVYGTSPY